MQQAKGTGLLPCKGTERKRWWMTSTKGNESDTARKKVISEDQ